MEMKTRFTPYLPFLTLISFISFVNILARVIFSPLTPFICNEMKLCHADTGNIFLMLSLGFAITLFVSQYLSAKFTHKFTIIFSVLTTGFALMLTAYATTFQQFRLAIFVVGVSAGFFMPSAVALIRENVPSHHLGKLSEFLERPRALPLFWARFSSSFSFVFGTGGKSSMGLAWLRRS